MGSAASSHLSSDAPTWLTLNSGTDYTFKITSTDNAGNSDSVCSPAIAVDNTPPTDATGLGWDDTVNYPTTLTSGDKIIARWTPSGSPDLNGQIIRFYDDGTCTGTLLETTPTQTAAGTSFAYSSLTLDATTYSFSVAGVDNAGNEDPTPPCSPGITVDKSSSHLPIN